MTNAEGVLIVSNVFQGLLFLITARQLSHERQRTEYYFQLWQKEVSRSYGEK